MSAKDYKIPEPTCSMCNAINKKYGERYCEGGKRPHRFKSKDPKRKVPIWCPKRKTSPIVRIYRFINEAVESLDMLLYNDIPEERNKTNNDLAYLLSHRYTLAYGGTCNITAKELYEAAKKEPVEQVLGLEVNFGNVVEIDDGIKPYFFYYQGYKRLRPAMFTPPEKPDIEGKEKKRREPQ